VTDPIESMLASAEAIVCAFAKALIVDREALLYAQESNDVMMAFQSLRQAYRTDVSPLIAQARVDAGGAIDVLGAFRASGWRKTQAAAPAKIGARHRHCVTGELDENVPSGGIGRKFCRLSLGRVRTACLTSCVEYLARRRARFGRIASERDRCTAAGAGK